MASLICSFSSSRSGLCFEGGQIGKMAVGGCCSLSLEWMITMVQSGVALQQGQQQNPLVKKVWNVLNPWNMSICLPKSLIGRVPIAVGTWEFSSINDDFYALLEQLERDKLST
ncbi:hypothetical protein LguiB_033832 [Lonicera macranthoides]